MALTPPLFGVTLALLAGHNTGRAQATLSVTPAYVYVRSDAPHGAFRLRSEGAQPLEVIVSAEYGVIATDDTGHKTAVELGSAGRLGDLTDRLTFFPHRLILSPGDERVVRFLVEGAEALPPGGYIVLMHYRMQERAAVSETAIPAVATAISIEYSLVTPLVVISGEGAARLTASEVDRSEDALALMLQNHAAFPFAGGITLWKGAERIARVASAVYTQRRIELILPAPLVPGRYTLRFDDHYPGVPAATRRVLHVPESITIDL